MFNAATFQFLHQLVFSSTTGHITELVDRMAPPRVEYQTCRCELAMKPGGTELCLLMAHTAALGQLLAR